MADSPRLFDRRLLRWRRTRLAGGLAAHGFLLEHVARDLAERLALVNRSFAVGIDVGAHGPGVARALLATGRVGEMVLAAPVLPLARAPGLAALVCDEEVLPLAAASLDLAVSALAFQLLDDLPGTLVQIRRALRPDGLLLAAMLGGRTLVELREAMAVAELETTGGISPRVAPFADVRELGALLQRAGFALPVADSEVLTVTYPSALALMAELRGMAAANPLLERRRAPLRRGTLRRAAEIYAERFAGGDGRVRATFEIVSLSGWAPAEGQPRPLRPGSAGVRLAEALGVAEQPAGEKAGR